MPAKLRSRLGRKGFVAVYMVFSMMVLIPMVGLAIDFSILYHVKARLQTAVDAAAVGAGAMLQQATDLTNAGQVANIKDAAQRFFNANYPAGYWSTTQLYYDSTPSEDVNTKVRTIYVHAAETVPMLFMRVLRINNSEVAAQAAAKVRFCTVAIVVDRSGSVLRAGDDAQIRNALTNFVVNTPSSIPAGESSFVDGRDVIGLVSYGGTYKIDYALSSTFRSGAPPISNAIANIPFGNSATNTAEGLYQGYQLLLAQNNVGAVNVIILLTDGRPSAFTAAVTQGGSCASKTPQVGFVTANVGQTWPPLPPTNWGGTQGPSTIWTIGFFNPLFSSIGAYGDMNFIAANAGCHYSTDGGQPIPGANAYLDIPNFGTNDAHGYDLTGPVDQGQGQSLSNPLALRYASINAADNVATAIRRDTTIRPVLFVIGLNQPPAAGEPLDADWLARVANDPIYKDVNGNSVFQKGQTSGMYFNVTSTGLDNAFQQINSQILRLAQ